MFGSKTLNALLSGLQSIKIFQSRYRWTPRVMEEAQTDPQLPPASRPSIGRPSLTALATVAGGLVATATMLGFLLHGCGHVAYSTYLRSWGVQEGLFPQSADWKIVRGYYALVLQSTGMFRDFPWTVVLISTLFVAAAIFMFRLPGDGGAAALRDWLGRRNILIALTVRSLIGSALLHYLLFVALLVGTFLAMLPGWIGERAGKQQATTERAALDIPGAKAETELWREGGKPIRGRVIASSETLIALYDMDAKVVRTLDRSQFELRATPPKLEESGTSSK